MWGCGHTAFMGYGWGPMGAMMLFGLVFLILVVVALVWIARGSSRGGVLPNGGRRLPGLDILEERYARGDIDRDEYLQKKRDIRGDAADRGE